MTPGGLIAVDNPESVVKKRCEKKKFFKKKWEWMAALIFASLTEGNIPLT